MTGLLASVVSVAEADIALAGGADILDLKDPSKGALGALAPATIAEIVAHIAKRRVVSATAGDLPMEPEIVLQRRASIGGATCRYREGGPVPGGDVRACISALRDEAEPGTCVSSPSCSPINAPDFSLIRQASRGRLCRRDARHRGKSSGGLRGHLPQESLRDFVEAAAHIALMTGLAGSLRLEDVAPLAILGPTISVSAAAFAIDGRQSA